MPSAPAIRPAATRDYDVVIYSGTPGGIMTALTLALAGQGYRVAIVEPTRRLGGMMTNGISLTDKGNFQNIGGQTWQVFQEIGQLEGFALPRDYGGAQGTAADYGSPLIWNFQAKNAQAVFDRLVQRIGCDVYMGARIDPSAVTATGRRIRHIDTPAGRFTARHFVDASYELDLGAGAGVPFHVGREASSVYGEAKAGFQSGDYPNGSFRSIVNLPATRDANGVPLYPLKEKPNPVPTDGTGDGLLMAFCYRICAVDRRTNPAKWQPFRRPPGYQSSRYQLILNIINRYGYTQLQQLVGPAPISGGKFDVNNGNVISINCINQNTAYPASTWAQREAIIREHFEWEAGLFWFLANDPACPQAMRDDASNWGLPTDEFTGTEGWPGQLYIREARRPLAKYILTQADVTAGTNTKSTSICKGFYPLDSHEVQAWPESDTQLTSEGYSFGGGAPAWQVPMDAVMPQAEHCTNLLFPVCMGSSHVAWLGNRLEPEFMMLGEACGVMLDACMRNDLTPQQLSYTTHVRPRLLALGAVL